MEADDEWRLQHRYLSVESFAEIVRALACGLVSLGASLVFPILGLEMVALFGQ